MLQDPVLLAIQNRAEVMTTFDILQSVHRPQEDLEPAQFLDCLSENLHHKQLSFQVSGSKMSCLFVLSCHLFILLFVCLFNRFILFCSF